MNIKIYKCNKCGNILLNIKDSNDVICCQEKMEELEVHEEKTSHTPLYYKQDKKVFVSIDHEMNSEHHIEAIIIKSDKELLIHYLEEDDDPEIILGYEQNMSIYSLCNKHGLYKTMVE